MAMLAPRDKPVPVQPVLLQSGSGVTVRAGVVLRPMRPPQIIAIDRVRGDMAHVAIIGAGIIGLATARELLAAGHRVTVLERAPAADRCSHGNAGGIAVTEVLPASSLGTLLALPRLLLDPLGPLHIRPAHLLALMPWFKRFVQTARAPAFARSAAALAALNLRATEDTARMLAAIGLADDLRRRGTFLLYESAGGLERDRKGFELMQRLGVVLQPLPIDAARAAEPALAADLHAAVAMPQWSQVADPARIVAALTVAVTAAGGDLVAAQVSGFEHSAGDRRRVAAAVTTEGERHAADLFVIAAGAWSARIAALVGERVLLEAERGYNATLPRPGVLVHRQLIFAERYFVATPLDVGLRIGGAAEFAGLEAPPHYPRAHALVRLAGRHLPGLDTSDARPWFGNRPSTPDGLPIIGHSSRADNVLHAYGHGHLGLTQSATTARLLLELVDGRSPSIDLAPYRPARFAARA